MMVALLFRALRVILVCFCIVNFHFICILFLICNCSIPIDGSRYMSSDPQHSENHNRIVDLGIYFNSSYLSCSVFLFLDMDHVDPLSRTDLVNAYDGESNSATATATATVTATVTVSNNSPVDFSFLHDATSNIVICCESCSCEPSWFFSTSEHLCQSLSMLPVKSLRNCATRLNAKYVSRMSSAKLCAIISDKFILQRYFFTTMSVNELHAMAPNFSDDKSCRLPFLMYIFVSRFGTDIFDKLRIPPSQCIDYDSDSNPVEEDHDDIERPWLADSPTLQCNKLKKFSKSELTNCINRLHPARCFTQSCKNTLSARADAIVRSFFARASELLTYTYANIIADLCSYGIPVYKDRSANERSLLKHEYSHSIFSALAVKRPSDAERSRDNRRMRKLDNIQLLMDADTDYASSWPQVTPDSVIFKCLDDYRSATQWKAPPVCAVCARSHDVLHTDLEISSDINVPLPNNFDILTSPLVCNFPLSQFKYIHFCICPDSSTIILDPQGLRLKPSDTCSSDSCLIVSTCTECETSLRNRKVPRFALANNLYRGELPEEFRDLTWVEEMVCSIYRVTAHVTRLYGSTDPQQPRIFKGNTCAHNMNVVSTANVLPRPPADVNSCITVVSIGPEKYKIDCLRTIFTIRKTKVCRFLLWLKDNNELFKNFNYDLSIFDMYLDNDLLPGIEDRVIIDTESDPDAGFAEETAGLADHPACQLHRNPEQIDSHSVGEPEPAVFVEKMGVSDTDGDTISGRSLTASAIRNLVPKDSTTPDLIIHHSRNAVPEYNNPSLLPGMFPTLFPYGLGGFEDPCRITPLSFDTQTKYYLDLHD